MTGHMKYAYMVLGAAALIALMSKAGSSEGSAPPKLASHTKQLVKEAARYSTVSDQDTNLLVKLLHTTYASAYINTARNMASDRQLERLAGVNINELTHLIQDQQQQAVQLIGSQAPHLMPTGNAAIMTGWIV